MVQFIRLRGDFWVGAGFISDHRTASQLLSQREAARMVKNFVQPIILALAYGTCASAKISCHSAGPGGPGAYIEDGTGSKAATKTAPTLLTLAAVVQGMVSEMSGRKMSYTITIEGKGAAAAAPKPFKTGKLRGRAGRRKIRRRKRLKPSRKEEMHTKKQLLILIKSMMTESDTWTLVSETSSRVGELT